MEWVETTGRTVEEAKRFALEQLGVGETDAEFEVVAEPRIGLFGRLKEEARVRARVQPRYPRPKGERRDRRRSRGPVAQEQSARGQSLSEGGLPEEEPSRAREPRRPRPDVALAQETPTATRRRRRTGGPGMTDRPDKSVPSTAEAKVSAEEQPGAEEQARLAENFLRGLLVELGAAATVSSNHQPNGTIEVLIEGEGLGTLIGPKGTTLLALQELTRIVLQRHAPTSDFRTLVDINGYRKRRQESLRRFAQQMAAEVLASKTSRRFEPMPPADRKIVHDAVNEVAGVTTISQGEEPERFVVLVPVGTDVAPSPAGPSPEGAAPENETASANQ